MIPMVHQICILVTKISFSKPQEATIVLAATTRIERAFFVLLNHLGAGREWLLIDIEAIGDTCFCGDDNFGCKEVDDGRCRFLCPICI